MWASQIPGVPEWFKTSFKGVQLVGKPIVYAETTTHAIVMVKGHSYFFGCASNSKPSTTSTRWLLVDKRGHYSEATQLRVGGSRTTPSELKNWKKILDGASGF